ncbi:hemerythrin domain-containing protein [Microbacterium sp. SS28]|uniref:hemerythrin domain-containing protein n=1 Tax=Microbacterium sp. SS28 TaxID=2919948 RepID=UPI001FAADF71|nr:hemerythrin domain-containing protein [Microbacterium sp. SS28]
MATMLPPSGEVPAGAGCDTKDLVFVHDAFRRLYQVMPAGVRGTPASDPKRVRAVARNVLLVGEALHHHHHFEDDSFWDAMTARKPACAIHVDLMRQHHREVAVLIDATPALIDAWCADPGPATSEPLAVQLEQTGAVLRNHLENEERLAMPVMQEVFTQEEWDALGAQAQKTYDRSQIFLFFGLIQDSLTPEVAADLMKEIPAVIRTLYKFYGRRQYERSLALLSAGTAVPGYRPSEGAA